MPTSKDKISIEQAGNNINVNKAAEVSMVCSLIRIAKY
jgi:hypothetical protein